MKLDYVFKHIKLILWGIAVAFMAQIIFTAQAYAQTTAGQTQTVVSNNTLSFEQKIEALSNTLETTSAAIESSTTLTNEQKRSLFVQLIELSRAILVLRSAAITEQVQLLTADTPTPGQNTLADAGVHKVQIDYEYPTAEATVTLYVDTPESIAAGNDIEKLLEVEYDTEQRTVAVTPSPGVGTGYRSVVTDVKNQIVRQLAIEKDLNETELSQVVFVSSRNPARGAPVAIAENSLQAIALSEDFGERSVIDQVYVMPGALIGRLLFVSDQEEILELTLTRSDYGKTAGDPNNTRARQVANTGAVTYQLETVLYHTDMPSLLRWYNCNGDTRNCPDPRPKKLVSEKDLPGTRAETIDFIDELFAEIPFTSQVRTANEDLLSFLVENPAYYDGDIRSTTYSLTSTKSAACVESVDELIVSEYVMQVMSGLQANYILHPDLIKYVVPTEAQDNGQLRCVGVKNFF